MNVGKHRRSEEAEPWEELTVRLQRRIITAQDAADQAVEYVLMPGIDTPQSSSFDDESETAVGVQASGDSQPLKRLKGKVAHHLVVHDKPLGRGGFGVVYRASKIEQGNKGTTEICLKHARDRSYDTLIQENEIFDRLQEHAHDSIIRRLFLCASLHDTFLGLELFEGYNLSEIIAVHKYKKLTIKYRHFINILKQQVEAILHLQNYGIFHCDIKPENILYNMERQSSKLIDFGLAVLRNGIAESFKSQGGTTEYMAPETLMDGYLCIGTDVYSLGATLCHLITLETPWHCVEDVQAIKSVKIEPNMPNTDQLKQQRRKDIRAAIKGEIERYRKAIEDLEVNQHFKLMSVQLRLHHENTCQQHLRGIVSKMLNHVPDTRPTCADILHYIETIQSESLIHRELSTMSMTSSTSDPPSSGSNIAILTNGVSKTESVLSESDCPAVLVFCESGRPDGTSMEITSDQVPAMNPMFSVLNKPSSQIYQPDEEKPATSLRYTAEMRSTVPSEHFTEPSSAASGATANCCAESVYSESQNEPSDAMNDYLMASNKQSSDAFSMPHNSSQRPPIPKFDSNIVSYRDSSAHVVEADGADPDSPHDKDIGPAGWRSPVEDDVGDEDDDDL